MKYLKYVKIILWVLAGLASLCLLTVGFLWLYLPHADFGFSRETGNSAQRLELVNHATAYLGVKEGSGEHQAIIDGYNAHEPLAQGYQVQYNDDWCATFVSFCAIEAGMTDIIPTECGCERQIGLFRSIDRWVEKDSYLPLPGDIIYYDWDVRTLGNSTGWSDHVGIVVGTHGPFIKVIEGNKDDGVGYRYIIRWDPRIRGYGILEESFEDVHPTISMTVATDLPGSPAVQEEFFYAYDTDGVLYKVWKSRSENLPSYDATERLVQDMWIYITLISRSDMEQSDGDPHKPTYEAQASIIQGGYTPTPGGEIVGGGRWFLATVSESSEDSILVAPRDDFHPSSLMVHTNRSSEFAPGDTVLVAYNGNCQSNIIDAPYDVIKGESQWHMFSTAQLGMALYDIDQDGKKELCGLGYGPTSGIFTFEVTVWEEGHTEHAGLFSTEFYYLSFVEDQDGAIRIQGVTQGDDPETVLFDMTAWEGAVQLTCNAEPITLWGSGT